MSDKGVDMTTGAKTMWSESLFESLYLALRKGKENDVIMGIVNDIKAKQYKDNYIIRRTKKDLGAVEGARVEALLTGKPVNSPAAKPAHSPGDQHPKPLSKADQARARAAKKRAEKGLLASLKRFCASLLRKKKAGEE